MYAFTSRRRSSQQPKNSKRGSIVDQINEFRLQQQQQQHQQENNKTDEVVDEKIPLTNRNSNEDGNGLLKPHRNYREFSLSTSKRFH